MLEIDNPRYEVVSCAFTLVDTIENIEKFLENKNIIVDDMRERKDEFSFKSLYYQLMTYSNLAKLSEIYDSYNFESTTEMKYKLIVHCIIKRLNKTNVIKNINSYMYQIDYEHILKFIEDEW